MNVRALGAVTASAAVAAALVFAGSASAASCPTWTDPSGDASLDLPMTEDPGLDIVRTTISSTGANVVVQVKVAELSDDYSGPGDEIGVEMTVNGKELLVYTDRDEGLVAGAGVYNITDETSGDATAKYDVATDTVTITATQAQFDAALGSAGKGKPATAVSGYASWQVLTSPNPTFDTAPAPAGTAIVIGTECAASGTPAPTGPAIPSPTTSPSPSTGPATYPKAGCNTVSDGTGDSGIAPVAGGPAVLGDADLDLTGLVLGTTPTEFVAFLRVADLKALPPHGNGHRFEVSFTHNAKVINIFAQQLDGIVTAENDALSSTGVVKPNPPVNTGGRVAGAYDAKLKVTSTFDVTNNVVILRLTRASLDEVAGKPAPDGTTVTLVSGASWIVLPTSSHRTDQAIAATPAAQVYTFGDSPCFEAPAAKLANTGRTSVQYTDAAAVAARLTDSAGQPLAGKTVTFAVGSRSVTARSGSDGVAKAALNPGVTAGAYSLVTSFAGDATAGKVSLTTPFSVVAEKTRIVLSVAKNGTRRTVTAKLLDDDGRAVAGQVVTWYVNGKKVTTSRTTSAGIATLTTAKPTQTVKVVFTAVTGKYLGSTAQAKV